MWATTPAARPPLSSFQFLYYSFDMLLSRFRSFDRYRPADPLITRKRREGVPFCQRFGIGKQGYSHIRWYRMHRISCDFLFDFRHKN